MARRNPHQPTIHEARSSYAAYDMSQGDDVAPGDVLVVPSEGVVGVADTYPIAVTQERGQLHTIAENYDLDTWARDSALKLVKSGMPNEPKPAVRSPDERIVSFPNGGWLLEKLDPAKEEALIAGFHAAVEEAERRGFPLGKAARFAAAKHHHAAMPRRNPVREQFDFDRYEEYARRLSNDQLHYSIQDALRALDVARTWDDGGAGEAKYSDQLGVLQQERRRRVDRQYFEERGVPRTNPEWAKSLGRGLYKGARYAGEAARDVYHGAKEAHSAHPRQNPEHPGFDQYDFPVSESFVTALLYGDVSGLSPEDEEALNRFYENRIARLGDGHWAVIEDDAGFGRDVITGLGADRVLLAYMVPRE